MKLRKFKSLIIVLFLILLCSCKTSKDVNNFEADKLLLNMHHEKPLFYYPGTTTKMQRKSGHKKFMPEEVVSYLKQKMDYDNGSNKEIQETDLLSSVPSVLDVIANSVNDLKSGDTQLVINKCKNILSILERNKTKTLDEEYGISPFRETYLMLALAYLQEENKELSLPILEKLVLYSNNWSAPYIVLSNYYYNKKAFGLALDVATRGIDHCTDNISYLYVLQAMSYRGMDNNIMAKKILNMANNLFPKNGNINLWFGIISFDEKKFDLVCKYFKLAFEYDNKDPYISHNYSYCLILEEKYNEASSVLSSTISNYPGHAHLYYLNGVLENLRNNYFAAHKLWQTYLTIADENDVNYKVISYKLLQMETNDKELFDKQYFPDPFLSK